MCPDIFESRVVDPQIVRREREQATQHPENSGWLVFPAGGLQGLRCKPSLPGFCKMEPKEVTCKKGDRGWRRAIAPPPPPSPGGACDELFVSR